MIGCDLLRRRLLRLVGYTTFLLDLSICSLHVVHGVGWGTYVLFFFFVVCLFFFFFPFASRG